MTDLKTTITLNEAADYVQNAVHDGTLRLIHPGDYAVCEEPGNGDYGVCGATAFVALPSDVVTKDGRPCRGQAYCLHCAADYLRGINYGRE